MKILNPTSMNKEKMLSEFNERLRQKVIDFFENEDRFDGEFILNSKFVKGSPFEKSNFFSEFTIYPNQPLPLVEILLGEKKDVSLRASARVASSYNPPLKGKDLNSWSSTIFSFTITANISYDKDREAIIVSDVNIRS